MEKLTSNDTKNSLPGISQERFDHLMFDQADRYPWVNPEVWETPMTDAEFKEFIAMQEETLKRKEG